ncbi:hypothetical protein L7F22_000866 [Adiantum nelumboides]|nr:hypothetical protein [Adiantum nelumboides]
MGNTHHAPEMRQLLKAWGQFQGKQALFLIDPTANENLISWNLAKDLGLKNENMETPLETRQALNAHDGDTMKTVLPYINKLKFELQGFKNEDSFCIANLDGKSSKGQSQKVQQQVLQKFRMGGFNTIVATSIVEEGLDIMEVDLVICFDANVQTIVARYGSLIYIVEDFHPTGVHMRLGFKGSVSIKDIMGSSSKIVWDPGEWSWPSEQSTGDSVSFEYIAQEGYYALTSARSSLCEDVAALVVSGTVPHLSRSFVDLYMDSTDK